MPNMNQNQRLLKFFYEKCQIFDEIFAVKACDQKFLFVIFYVKSYLEPFISPLNNGKFIASAYKSIA